MPKKKRKKYKTGIYHSKKGGVCKYRSGWELAYMRHLDDNHEVVSFEYESIKIDYISNVKTKKVRIYKPDFFVSYADGSTKLIEIKPKRKLSTRIVVKKVNAAIDWCQSRQVSFVIITEDNLKEMNLI